MSASTNSYTVLASSQIAAFSLKDTSAGSSSSTSTSIYLALLGLADSFQRSGQYRSCIHCLESILTLKHRQDVPIIVNFHIQLKTRLNLCRLYLKHTINTNQYLNAHLEKAVCANEKNVTILFNCAFTKQKNINV